MEVGKGKVKEKRKGEGEERGGRDGEKYKKGKKQEDRRWEKRNMSETLELCHSK